VTICNATITSTFKCDPRTAADHYYAGVAKGVFRGRQPESTCYTHLSFKIAQCYIYRLLLAENLNFLCIIQRKKQKYFGKNDKFM
jgi:hypothetical protein